MSHRPKKPIERRTEGGLSGPELEHLIRGMNFVDWERVNLSDEARRALWVQHRDHIMSLQGKPAQGEAYTLQRMNLYFDLFERPSAWWDFEAPEPRRLLAGDPGNVVPGCGLLQGTPRRFRDGQAMVFESERDYLERHGLLNDRETAKVPKQQFLMEARHEID